MPRLGEIFGRQVSPTWRTIGTAVPPARMPLHIPLLRDSVYGRVNQQLRHASGAMRGLGVNESADAHDAPLFWQALGPQRRWPTNLPTTTGQRVGIKQDIFQPRAAAARSVAQELEFHVPQFRGLTRKIRYEPWYDLLDKYDGAATDMGTGDIRLGSRAFQSPGRLTQVLMHEGRHYQQWRDFGRTSGYTRPNTLAEADAYLFDLEHRNLSQMSRGDMAFTLGRFRRLCDVNDRLAAGQPVDRRWNATEAMNPVRRADLELRYSFIEPSLRRELGGTRYGPLWSALPTTFGYRPLRPVPEPHPLLPDVLRGLR
jgi:hypothetical protein